MEEFVKGDVVVVPFPFSDLSQAKRRPALVVSSLEGEDIILCQITSQVTKDKYAVAINNQDFENGLLKQPSNVRPNRIFTADSGIVLYKIGHLNSQAMNQISEKIIALFR